MLHSIVAIFDRRNNIYFFITNFNIMKKFFSMMAVLAAMFAFASCEPTVEPEPESKKLATPVLSETHTDTSFTISWDAVSNAELYIVNMAGKNYNTTECEYTFENLNAGDYTVRVQATANGYTSSDAAKIVVTLTGLQEVDWFEMTAKAADVNEEEGYGPYNAIEFLWKGTGVAALSYGIYDVNSLLGVTDSQIKNALTAVNDTTLASVNSAEGLGGVFGPLSGGTTYAIYVLVENADGLEFFTHVEVATERAEASEETKAWLGTWEVNSTKKYSINDKGVGTVIDGADKFTVTITESANDPNEVIIDGLSVLGAGSGWITTGLVYGDTLYILNGTYLGDNQDGSFSYYWVGFYSEPVNLTLDSYPSNIVTMDDTGAAATSTNQIELQDSNGSPVPVTCYTSDIFGVTPDGGLMFFIEAFPGVYRTGDMTWTKVEPTASAKSFMTNYLNVESVISSSVVVAR